MAQAYLNIVEKSKLVEKQTKIEKESQQDLDFFLCNENEPKIKKRKKNISNFIQSYEGESQKIFGQHLIQTFEKK